MPQPSPRRPFSPQQRIVQWRTVLWRLRHLRIIVPALVFALVFLKAVTPDRIEHVEVLTAAHAMEAGTQLSDKSISSIPIPRDVADHLHLTQTQIVRDLVAAGDSARLRVSVPAGTPLTSWLLSSSGVAGLLTPGRVAVTIEVASAFLVQSLQPGDRVDVLVANDSTSRRVATDAEILPWPQPVDESADDFSGVTANTLLVSVTPSEAAKISTVAPTQWLSVVVVAGS